MLIPITEKLNLELLPAQQSIKVENGTTEACSGVAKKVLARLRTDVVYLDLLILPGAPYHRIIGAPELTNIRVRIDRYIQCVRVRHEDRNTSTNLEYERENEKSSDEQFASELENESSDSDGEDGDQKEFIMTLSEVCENPYKSRL